jgi:methanogenic corrinoid protein MtbC1
MDDAALRRMVQEVEGAAPLARLEDGKTVSASETVRSCLISAEALDGVALEKALRRSAVVLGVWELVVDVLVPLMHEIGRRWHSGRISPAHEHLASGVIGRTLSWIMDSTSNNGTAPVMVVGTPSGEAHELGAMLAAATAAAEGWRIVYLGSNLPAVDIVNAATQVGASCVALSIIFPESEPAAIAQVARIRKLLPQGTSLIVGGPEALAKARNGPTGVHFVHEIAALPGLLDSLAPR